MQIQAVPLRRLAARAVEGIDWPLLAIALLIVGLGLATLYSASYEIPGRVLHKSGGVVQELRRMRVRVSIPELDVDVTVPAAAWPR